MSLKTRVLNAIHDHTTANPDHPFIHKGQIERYFMESGYTLGDTVSRRLRELESEGRIISRKVGKSIEYRYVGTEPKPVPDQSFNSLTDIYQEA